MDSPLRELSPQGVKTQRGPSNEETAPEVSEHIGKGAGGAMMPKTNRFATRNKRLTKGRQASRYRRQYSDSHSDLA